MADQFIDISGWYLIAGQKDISLNTTVNSYMKPGFIVNKIVNAFTVDRNNQLDASSSKAPGYFTVDDWKHLDGTDALKHNLGVWINLDVQSINPESKILLIVDRSTNLLTLIVPSKSEFQGNYGLSAEYINDGNNDGILAIIYLDFSGDLINGANNYIETTDFASEFPNTGGIPIYMEIMPGQTPNKSIYYNSGADFSEILPSGSYDLLKSSNTKTIPDIDGFQVVLNEAGGTIQTYTSVTPTPLSNSVYKDGSSFMEIREIL
jgi:hypothetical protein